MNHHQHGRQHNHSRSSAKRGGGNGQVTLKPGSVILRILCHVDTAGGVIGSSGSIIKQLETQTGCIIRFEDPFLNCHERVINVIGDAVINKKITLKSNEDVVGRPQLEDDDSGDCLEVEVSTAQEGLIRVFERVLKVERNENGVIGCRLLAGLGQVGAVMGRGGKIVGEIQRNSGAKIRVLNKDQTPSCATAEEELIQITGHVMAVKKALLAVSHCLQVCMPWERKRSHLFPSPEFQDAHADLLENHNPMPQSFSGSDDTSVGISLSEDVDRILSLDKGSAQRKVVFRLLCSNSSAGGVIGKGATVVKELEKQTGASIKFSAPVAGSNERVATISSLENQDSSISSARNAVVCAFTRSVEVGLDKGYIADLGGGETVIARILVSPNEINCLIDDGGRIASDISVASSVEIQLLGANRIPNCTSGDDKVVQIGGEYEKVKSALFQVTGRLRDNLFSSTIPEESSQRQHSYSAAPSSSPYGICTSPEPDNSSQFSFADQINCPGFVRKLAGSNKFSLQGKQFKYMEKPRNLENSAETLSGGTVGQKSMNAGAMLTMTIEVVVPEKVFGCVYGENGSNLARLKEISGATITLQDPTPGKSDGKVIISGTRERIQVAQSLLQAFILTQS